MIKLIDFLKIYDFRYYDKNNNNDDCFTVRIYYSYEEIGKWIEIGVSDWEETSYKINVLKDTINKEILNSYVYDFKVNYDNYFLEIYLTKREDYQFD